MTDLFFQRKARVLMIAVIATFFVFCATAIGAADDQSSAQSTADSAVEVRASQSQNEVVDSADSDGNVSIADGEYTISSAVDENKVIDVSENNQNNGANVQIYDSNGSSAQKFNIHKNESGDYTITNSYSHKSLDVAGGNSRSGANVQMYDANGTAAQRWKIKSIRDGFFIIENCISGKVLDVAGGSRRNGANLQVYSPNGTCAQLFKLILLGKATDVCDEVIPSGDYVIVAKGNGFKAIDTADASKADGANVQLYEANGTGAQRYHLEYHKGSRGYYTITSATTGKSLDVAGGSSKSGANVQMYTANGTSAQKWIIRKLENGYCVIINMISGKNLDISAGSLANGTNIQVWNPNDTDAQQFSFLLAKNTENISDGVYSISSADDQKLKVELSDEGITDGTNIHISSTADSDFGKFIFKRLRDNIYRIYSCVSGKVIDVSNGSSSSGANVQAWSNNDSAAQQWCVNPVGDGTYYLRALCGENVLGFIGPMPISETNVLMCTPTGGISQKFILAKTNWKPVQDGAYVIHSNQDSDYVLDILNGDRSQKADVQLYEQNGTPAQVFLFQQGSDGFYVIKNVNSRHVLDVVSGSKMSFAKIDQYCSNGTLAQKWIISDPENTGIISLISAVSSKAVDIFGMILSNGAVIQQYDYNRSGAQQFVLEKTDYDHSLDIDSIDYSFSNYYPSPVQIAQSQIGINIGTEYWVSYFGTRFISGRVTPWCGCFVSWIFNHAGQGYKLNGIHNKASVGSYYSYANATGRWTNTPVSGDIVVFGNKQHVGIVEKVIDGYVYTIEGNTGPTYNGEVKRHGFRRDDKWISGFIHLP